MRIINWGIIGAGGISSVFAQALVAMEDSNLVAIASRDKERAKEFASKHQIERAYGSYEDLVKDSDIDVVYIGTPHSEHKANAALCIKNGKSVLCEKCFTINQFETQYLINLAKEHNVFLMEAMWTKFLPTTKQVKAWIAEGRIGNIKHMKVMFGFKSEYNESHRLFNINTAGGALLDVGVYVISYATHIMEKLPEQVLSTAVLAKNGVDEQNSIIFKYDNGAIALLGSGITVGVGSEAIIIGDKGKIVIHNFWMAEEATLYDEEGNVAQAYKEKFKINGYEFEAGEVNQCIREGKLESDYLPLSDTLDIIKIMDSMRAEWGLRYPQEIDG